MSLKLDDIDLLRERLNENSGLNKTDFIEKVWIDVALPMDRATIEQSAELELLEPFGQGNEKPVFAQKGITVMTARSVGNYKNFIRMRLRDDTFFQIEGIAFGDSDEMLKSLAKKPVIDILYYPKVNAYNGKTKVEIQIKTWK